MKLPGSAQTTPSSRVMYLLGEETPIICNTFEFSYCSNVYESRESAESAALSLANEIASKSPVAVQGSKVNLNYSRDHPVDVALDYAVSLDVPPAIHIV